MNERVGHLDGVEQDVAVRNAAFLPGSWRAASRPENCTARGRDPSNGLPRANPCHRHLRNELVVTRESPIFGAGEMILIRVMSESMLSTAGFLSANG
jgi:hypothetical protein